MDCGRRVRAAAATAAALVSCAGVPTDPARAGPDTDPTVILFSGNDMWRNGAFLHGGLVLGPGAFGQDGFLLKLLASGGTYRYNAGNLGGATVTGGELIGTVLPGWRMKRGGVEAKFFFGADFAYHPLWPDDPANRLRGRAVGMRMALELWYEPTPATMAAADFSLTSIINDTTGRLAYGWHVFEDWRGGFYVGPEVQYFGSDGYRHLRFGVHLTRLKAGKYEWSAGSGWVKDSEGRSGPYLRIGVMTRR